jgi:hypothetical protein
MFENRVLRRIYDLQRDGGTGGWRKDTEKLRDFYFSPSIIRIIKSRRMKLAGHVARMEETRTAYSSSVGKPGGKRPLSRPRRRLVDNIELELLEIVLGGVDWTGRDKRRAIVNAVMNLLIP